MKSAKFGFLILAALTFAAGIRAELTFEQTSVLVKAMAEDRTLAAKFSFTNAGAGEVTILSVTTSCECTGATLEKMSFAAGESGAVAVSYKIGANEGVQTQTVTLITSEKAGTTYVLTFKADIPKKIREELPPVVPISPGMLIWTKRPFQAKTVKVDLSAVRGAKLTATASGDGFNVSTKEFPDKHVVEIDVTPVVPARETRGELLIVILTESGKTLSYKVPLSLLQR